MLDMRSALVLLEDAWHQVADQVKALRSEWAPRPTPVTVLFSELAHTIAASWASIPDPDRLRIFEVVEDLIACGSRDVVEGTTTGFLEALLAQASSGRLDFDEIGPLLGQRTTDFCRSWDDFTGIRTPGLTHE